MLRVASGKGSGSYKLHLRPKSQTQFGAWFAALLCWQPLRSGQIIHHASSHTPPLPIPALTGDRPRLSRSQNLECELAPVNSGPALLLRHDSLKPTSAAALASRSHVEATCTLRGNGELSIHAVQDRGILAGVHLGSLPRSAIQRLSKSVFNDDHVLAIYPQYAQESHASSRLQPICLSFGSGDLYENWFVLLRAFAAPELYGLQSQSRSTSMVSRDSAIPLFRIEHFLSVRINKANLFQKRAQSSTISSDMKRAGSNVRASQNLIEYYAEILLDEQVTAKTSSKSHAQGKPVWYEIHDFTDVPSRLSTVSVRVRKKAPWPALEQYSQPPPPMDRISTTQIHFQDEDSVQDPICGEIIIEASKLKIPQNAKNQWPLTDIAGDSAGEISLDLLFDEEIILMEKEYDEIFEILEDFPNAMTLLINERIPSKPVELAELFLNIFQASYREIDWFKSLIEDEIYATRKRPTEKDAEEEDLAVSASLLFRGNTLLTRALDSFMKRIGQAYLKITLREKMQRILDNDLDCEIDPSRMEAGGDYSKNFQRLITVTEEVWALVRGSATKCPKKLRSLFKHIRDCAAVRYGDFVRSKIYTSVSSFLFLRFFSAAVLSPRLFGLIRGRQPKNGISYMFL